MTRKRILIIGATSAMAEATARTWAADHHQLYLVGRDEERLTRMTKDLSIRGAHTVEYATLDLNHFDAHQAMIEQAVKSLGGLDIALIAHGTLSDQKACEQDFNQALTELNTNAISVMSLLTHLANYFEAQKAGTLAVISSVAGERGRQSNYVYGAAKGAVSLFLQGLRQRLDKSGVHVLTIKPGFVDTPMTKDLKKGLLWAQPHAVAKLINKGVASKKNIIYTPDYWALIMAVIKAIPERLFKKVAL
jgi:decaprenylphospho-beta-D-erythro-pentofuranosid-2-ulose 2-reductase